MKIRKYTFGVGKSRHHLTEDAEFLKVDLHLGHLTMWWSVGEYSSAKPVTIHTAATGDETPNGEYLGSVGETHVYQETP